MNPYERRVLRNGKGQCPCDNCGNIDTEAECPKKHIATVTFKQGMGKDIFRENLIVEAEAITAKIFQPTCREFADDFKPAKR